MGQTYLIVNSAKRQFLDPSVFGENSKQSGLFYGLHATALGLMVTKAQTVFDHFLVGSWSGDSVAVTGDYASDEWLRVKSNFEDISTKAIGMLCSINDHYANELVDKAKRDEGLFVDLGTVAHHACPGLAAKLQSAFGAQWRSRYEALFSTLRG